MSYFKFHTHLVGCHAWDREGLLCGKPVAVTEPVALCAEHAHLGRQDA